ncbi:hypothetical protein Q1695_005249 [Nippostrongylus brasiliensis]|nr:hypothetical protein Q1695_005249 [Nippostrongylus brasiliensis]
MLLLLVLTTLFVYYLSDQWRKTTKLPPGPYPILLFGNLPQIMYYGIKYGGIAPALREFKKKYGPVFTLWLGPLPSVRIADYKLSQEAMAKKTEPDHHKWTNAIFIVIFFDGRGLIFSNGALWQEQRRFSLHALRNLGVSKNLVEERIMDEFNLRCDEVDQLPPNSSIEPTTFFDQLVGGVMNRMLFSVQPNEDDEKRFFDLKKKMDDMVERASVVDLFVKNWVLNVPIINIRWKNMFRPTLELKEFIREQIQTRKRAIGAGTHVIHSEPRDYVDAFIVKMLEHEKEDVDGNTFDDETLAVNVLDLWIAGQETTSTSLVWAVLYMLQNPQVMDKVRKELLEVTGRSGTLSLKNRMDTPYLNATIAEIQRHSSILNNNIFRMSSADTEIGGYSVPKDTIVSAELSVILSDDSVFSNPEQFNPSRFIDDPTLLSNVIPFGLGRRACLGEALARAELHLILGNLLLRYSIQPVGTMPSSNDVLNKFGIMKKSQHFKISLTKIV